MMTYTEYKTKESVYQGLAQLLKAEIIARGPSDSFYFINPLVAFNGNRVTYAKTYVKKKKEKDPNQTNLFDLFEKKTKAIQVKMDDEVILCQIQHTMYVGFYVILALCRFYSWNISFLPL